MSSPTDYELLDVGGGARLERFGQVLVDRPHPGALGPRSAEESWHAADLRFDRERGWVGHGPSPGSWRFAGDGLTLELRPTEAGQVGLFPEHLAMIAWLRSQVVPRMVSGPRPAVLHLFAYTGLATLAMAASGAEVTHVDAARAAIGWARRNAELSGLADRPVRWIVDDALGFTHREVRRGRTYAGVVLDPPSYGHGPGSRPWRLVDDLSPLLAAISRLLEPGGFVLLTAHTPGFEALHLARLVETHLPATRGRVDRGTLAVSTTGGRELELGAFARSTGRA